MRGEREDEGKEDGGGDGGWMEREGKVKNGRNRVIQSKQNQLHHHSVPNNQYIHFLFSFFYILFIFVGFIFTLPSLVAASSTRAAAAVQIVPRPRTGPHTAPPSISHHVSVHARILLAAFPAHPARYT